MAGEEERNARTSRLCRHGAILEGVFPAIVTEDGESVKAFLVALSRLPGARDLEEKMLNGGGTEYDFRRLRAQQQDRRGTVPLPGHLHRTVRLRQPEQGGKPPVPPDGGACPYDAG